MVISQKYLSIVLIVLGLGIGGYGLSKTFDRSLTVSTDTVDIAVKKNTARNNAAIFMGVGLLMIIAGTFIELRRPKNQ